MRKRVLGDEHPDTLESMQLDSSWPTLPLPSHLVRWDKLAHQTGWVQDHSDTFSSMSNLAFNYGNQGLWKKDEKLQVQVLETGKR